MLALQDICAFVTVLLSFHWKTIALLQNMPSKGFLQLYTLDSVQ